jgi:hypothetical protein
LDANTILFSYKRLSVVFILILRFLVSNASYGAEWPFTDVLRLEIERQGVRISTRIPVISFIFSDFNVSRTNHVDASIGKNAAL